MSNKTEIQFVVCNPYQEWEEDFRGTHDECQDYLANYGAGWTELKIMPARLYDNPLKKTE